MELNKVIDLEALTASGFPEGLIEQASGFMELMMQYRCALMEVETKLNVLNAEFTMKNNRNPFESIKSRIKTPKSILEKLRRKGFEISVKGIEENLADVAGIRVICSFPDDIYATAKMLTDQDDIRVIQVKDYIINPLACSINPERSKSHEAERLQKSASDFGGSDFLIERKEEYEGRGAVSHDCDGFLGKFGA